MSESQQSIPSRVANGIITFGKYRGEQASAIAASDTQYLRWVVKNMELRAEDRAYLATLLAPYPEVVVEKKPLTSRIDENGVLTIGKYKGNTIEEIYKKDAQYVSWLKNFCKMLNEDDRRMVTNFLTFTESTPKESLEYNGLGNALLFAPPTQTLGYVHDATGC